MYASAVGMITYACRPGVRLPTRVSRVRVLCRMRTPFCRDGANVVIRALRPGEFLEFARESALRERSEAEDVPRATGVVPEPHEFVVSCPIRFRVGGVGGSRFLGTFPRPAPLR